MTTYFRCFFILVSFLFIGLRGSASSLEGVYIEEKGSVVLFSDSYQIVNFKSKDKMVFCPIKIGVKKETKLAKKSPIKIQNFSLKKHENKKDVKIPIKHLLFKVKNFKNREISVLKSKSKILDFCFIYATIPFSCSCCMNYLYSYISYSVESQWDVFILNTLNTRYLFYFQMMVLSSLVIGKFFYSKCSEKAKYVAIGLKRGPPVR